MAVTATSFHADYLASSSVTLYTVGGSVTAVVTNIVVCNEDTVTRTFTITVDGKALFPAVAIDANTTYPIDMRKVVPAGKVIAGFASVGSKVTAHISGAVIS